MNQDDTSRDSGDCSICLQPIMHPTQLPCRHIFCFLCIKGITYKSHRCALCRSSIPPEFLDDPNLLNQNFPAINVYSRSWYYEGRNGWWQYDDRTSLELEEAYLSGKEQISLLIAGNLYCIDFRLLHQYRINEPTKFRRVKRDYKNRPTKGVGGIKVPMKFYETNVSESLIGGIQNLST